MNFTKAYKELMAGEKIRRKGWEKYLHIQLVEKEAIVFKGEINNFYTDASVITSNDWMVRHQEDNKKYTFIEALDLLKQGNILKREDWETDTFLFVSDNQLVICHKVRYDFMPSYEDLMSTDWEILK